MSLILEDDNYVASKPHIFQNLLPHENNLHVSPAWLAASLMSRAWFSVSSCGDSQGPGWGGLGGGKGLVWGSWRTGFGLHHPFGSWVGRITSRVAFCRISTPWHALQDAWITQAWDSPPATCSSSRSTVHMDPSSRSSLTQLNPACPSALWFSNTLFLYGINHDRSQSANYLGSHLMMWVSTQG